MSVIIIVIKFIFQVSIVYGLPLYAAWLLGKSELKHFIKLPIKFLVFLISFLFLFFETANSGRTFVAFSISLMMIAYLPKICKLVWKVDFGEDDNYRAPMYLFLLVLMYAIFKQENILNLNVNLNAFANVVWIVLLGDQFISIVIDDANKSREKKN